MPDVMEPPTKTPTRTRPKTSTKFKLQPPYAVVILNDEDHTFEYVIMVIQKVFKYSLQKAVVLTTEIHEKGRTVVWSGSLEVAELKKEQIQGMGPDKWSPKKVDYPLGVDLEPMA